ncbi:hypothetical protein [Hymenobacter defluvii]|uniref:Uncharacterized protein n=1 Tax=Hymenobacter defluvii TaxID=2054411 RepID=A0ABS3TER8_9BACT|nr:hypothetical protein [Hymenobacter defluvii]MBO3272132.1 hypothetical protein [Hymenobacter defluvii]
MVVSYPVNYWLVKNKLKHGMGTERALGKGGAPLAETAPSAHAGHSMSMTGMTHGQALTPPAAAHSGHNMAAMPGVNMSAGAPVSGGRRAVVTLLTLVMLAVGYYLAARYGDLTMRAGDSEMLMSIPRYTAGGQF